LQVTSIEVLCTKIKYYLEGGLAREQQNLPITVQIQNTQWSQRILLYLGVLPWATMNQHPPVHHEGWTVSGQETVFRLVPVPWLTMVFSLVTFFTT